MEQCEQFYTDMVFYGQFTITNHIRRITKYSDNIF